MLMMWQVESTFSVDGEEGEANLSSKGLAINFLASLRWQSFSFWFSSCLFFIEDAKDYLPILSFNNGGCLLTGNANISKWQQKKALLYRNGHFKAKGIAVNVHFLDLLSISLSSIGWHKDSSALAQALADMSLTIFNATKCFQRGKFTILLQESPDSFWGHSHSKTQVGWFEEGKYLKC